jgi:GAF domain-containing protein
VHDSDTDQGRLKKLGSEIFRAAAVDLAGRALVAIGFMLLAAFGLLVWKGGSLPAWLVLLIVVFVIAIAFGILRGQSNAVLGATEDNEALQWELRRHNEYSRHLQYSLDALQRVICRDVDAEIPYFLEQAVLEPALRILSEKPAEKVRLSVLMPADNDPELWSMRWAAGHSMIGKLKFAEPIAGTLARHAVETGEPQYWPDTEAQTEFQQNPLASAPMKSLVSIPIQEGDEVLGVFNAISSEKEAFDEAEQTFLASLGGVIAVAVSVWHQNAEPVPDSDRGRH